MSIHIAAYRNWGHNKGVTSTTNRYIASHEMYKFYIHHVYSEGRIASNY